MRSGSYTSGVRPDTGEVIRIQWMFPCKDGNVALAFQGANRAAARSSRALVVWANEEGYALGLKDYVWEMWDSRTIEQSDLDFRSNEIAPFLLTKTKDKLLEEASKRKILLAPVTTVADLPQNNQLAFREFWFKVFHPELNDTLTYPGPSVRVPECPQQIHQRAPTIGEHNRDIYEGELGLSSEQLSLLKRQEVI